MAHPESTCQNCGAPVVAGVGFCEKCGAPVAAKGPQDKQSIGINILSFLFPLIGIILFFVWKNSSPNKAKGAGLWALISIAIGFVSVLLL